MKTHQTLGEFIIQHQKDFQHSTGEFSRLLSEQSRTCGGYSRGYGARKCAG